MTELRTATTKDIPMLRALWQECFGDSDAFCDWFFAERFSPDLSVIAEEKGKILSMAHGWPFTLSIRSKAIPAIMMCGVATHPAARGKGLMTKCLSLFMTNAREKGFLVLFQKPVDFDIYLKLGHYASYNAAILTKKEGMAYIPAPHIKDSLCSDTYAEELLPIYKSTAENYSCSVIRSLEYMALKLRDYAADGGRLLRYGANATTAYAVYYITDDELAVPEIMDNADTLPLLHTIACLAENRKLNIKMPSGPIPEGFDGHVRPWGAMTALNVPTLLKELCGYSHIAAEITDPILPQNNGIFAFDGAPAATAHIRLESGRLMQLLSGYADISTLLSQGHAELLAPISDTLMEHFPSLPCFTVEEY
ncbi:MAG: GNAT family N-acetyltransferase [Clostridia bacterium]|nr:GNAT family N-acetyltransferase [Clostridia bacterium]